MANVPVIQGPHCLVDTEAEPGIDAASALTLISDMTEALGMKPLGTPRVVDPQTGELTAYQIISTSHVIIHVRARTAHADLFSCEPFDVDLCVSRLIDAIPGARTATSRVQYCQRNLLTAPAGCPSIPMTNLNSLTSNPETFTHAMANLYSGDEARLGDARLGRDVLARALEHLGECIDPAALLDVLAVDPVESSWDLGGISGGYVDICRQLTLHTFAGLNGAYADVMANTFDLESILTVLREGFGFEYYEVDGIFQRER